MRTLTRVVRVEKRRVRDHQVGGLAQLFGQPERQIAAKALARHAGAARAFSSARAISGCLTLDQREARRRAQVVQAERDRADAGAQIDARDPRADRARQRRPRAARPRSRGSPRAGWRRLTAPSYRVSVVVAARRLRLARVLGRTRHGRDCPVFAALSQAPAAEKRRPGLAAGPSA